MVLCSNRFPLAGSPSTCILDTALVPLPSFLFIAFGALTLLLFPYKHRARQNTNRWIHWIYFVLVIAAVAMQILELARLAADHEGVGLLPVILVVQIIVLVSLWIERKGRTIVTASLFLSYWLLNIVFQSIRVARLKDLEKAVHGAPEYPGSDQLLDNAVVLGLYVVFVFFEASVLATLFKHRRNGTLAAGPGEPKV